MSRVWTEDEIKILVQTNDKVLYGALKRLYAEQTADEQSAGETHHHNGAGFNGADSRFLEWHRNPSGLISFRHTVGYDV